MLEKNRTIVFAEDHPIFRGALISTFSNQKEYCNYSLLGASNGIETLEYLKNRPVDVVFTDIGMPEMDGIQCLKIIKENYPKCKVILLSQYDDLAFIQQAIAFGADAYLLKNADPADVIKCFESVMNEIPYFQVQILKKLVEGNKISPDKIGTGTVKFTSKQIQILQLLCEEYSNEDIAKIMEISISTVKTYKNQLFKITATENSFGLALYAVKHNIYKIK